MNEPRASASTEGSARLLRRLLRPGEWLALDEHEARAFERYRDDLMLALWPVIGLLVGGAALLWWPLDYVVYAGRPDVIQIYGGLRASVILLTALALLFARTRIARWRPAASFLGIAVAESALIGFWVGRLGGLDGPWFSYFYVFPFLTVLYFVGPAARISMQGAMWSAFLVGCYLAAPGALQHQDLPSTLTYLLFVIVLSFSLGHLTYTLVRSNFVFRRRLAAKRDELDGLAAGLESRVAEQTDDLRRLARRLESVRESERRLVAREIHDQLGQRLTAVRYGLSFAGSQIEPAPRTAARVLAEVEGLVAHTSDTVRHLLSMLHPRALEELGLFRAADWLLEETTRHVALEARLHCHGQDDHVPDGVATGAFRILQEGINNAVKHAGASQLEIRLDVDRRWLRLTIRDDGVGPPANDSGLGLGLVGIRERARTLGGSAAWRARGERGFELLAELPLVEGGAA